MSRSARRIAFAAVLALSCLALFGPPALAQCSMCQQVVASSPEARRVGAELNRAILLMFVAPYLIFTSFALVLFRDPIGRHARRLSRIFFLPR